MAKNSEKVLGTTATVIVVIGVLLLGLGAGWLIRKYLKKSQCEKAGGIWDEKTKTCILPKKEDIKEKKVLKDAYDNLTFESGKAIIKPTSYPFLDEIPVVFANEEAKLWTLDIKGHTDNQGTQTYNQKLSEERAKSVKTYLVSKGIDISRISSSGYGYSKPIDSNDTPEGRSKNRRVEFTILKPSGEIVTTPTPTPIVATPIVTNPEIKTEIKPVETVVITKEQKVILSN